MRPRHFWWLVGALEKPKPGNGVTKDERKQLLAMLEAAEQKA
jgi:hypothetical protein